MEIVHKDIQNNLSSQGSTTHRPICLKNISIASPIHLYVTRPFSRSQDGFQINWSRTFTYAFPPFSLVPRVTLNVYQKSTSTFTEIGSSKKSRRKESPLIQENSLWLGPSQRKFTCRRNIKKGYNSYHKF